MEPQRGPRPDELLLGPGHDGRSRRVLPARGLPVLVVAAVLVSAAVSGPGLLSGSPADPAPTEPPSASASAAGDAPMVTWTGDAARSPGGNAFVQSSTRLLRLPAT